MKRTSLSGELLAEFLGTMVLLMFGAGVVAMVVLFSTGVPGEGVKGGYTNITLGWGLGVVMGIYPYLTLPGLAVGVVWLVVTGVSRYVALGSIAAAVALPIAFVVVSRVGDWPLSDHAPLLALCLLLAAVVLVRHRANIARQEEHRFGRQSAGDGHALLLAAA